MTEVTPFLVQMSDYLQSVRELVHLQHRLDRFHFVLLFDGHQLLAKLLFLNGPGFRYAHPDLLH